MMDLQNVSVEAIIGIVSGVGAAVAVIGVVVLKIADTKLNGKDKKSSMETQEKIRDVLSDLNTSSKVSSGSLGRIESGINKLNDELARRPCIVKKD